MTKKKRNFIVMGDFNIDILDDNSPMTRKLADLLGSFGLNWSITSPTRVTTTLATAIDNVVTNLSDTEALVVNTAISDHYGQQQTNSGSEVEKSTTDAIVRLVDMIVEGMEDRGDTLSVFLDLSKAFDCVDHHSLILKLEHYGVRGVPLKWLESYLSDRKQFVGISDVRSEGRGLYYGVPQGSILSPLLFLIYVNDVGSSVSRGQLVQIPENVPLQLVYACIVLRMLYNIALDTYDKPNQNVVSFKSPSHKRQNIESQRSLESPSSGRRINSLNLTPPAPDPVVVHSGVVIAMLQLIPSIQDLEETQQSLTLQVYMTEVVKSLVRSERNQQVMCDSGTTISFAVCGSQSPGAGNSPLHSSLQYMFERLATQNLEPKDLREFLRLGSPLCCLPMDTLFHSGSRSVGGPVPLTRIKTLVSMTTPRSHEPTGPSVVNVATLTAPDSNVVGGIGSGDRIFPPQTGLSYSTWVCVERFSDPRSDPHCVRLLTLVRNLHSARDDHLICLAMVLSARDKAIIITTQETPLNHTSADWEPEGHGGLLCQSVVP
ncbi:WD repeat and FYVE domain-containing protein 3-like [Homalodisca vitripennis]|uniref:WD repeat and FYVE domain-containing protein 3-like n=1 Tax=Homalodisca vitripennis TaxID=197043 RepID=UPI001EECBF92|nr:WD repeat and FYVE domain-containing protein 3-like [Homalodisca vitripennis]